VIREMLLILNVKCDNLSFFLTCDLISQETEMILRMTTKVR